MPDALSESFTRAIASYRARHFDEAEALCRATVCAHADHFLAFHLLALAQWQLGRLQEAMTNYEKALAIKPDYAQALINRGVTLYTLKRFEEALASYDKALAIKPDYAEALSNRGVTLHHLQCFEDGLASYNKALAIKPHYAEVLYNRGITLQSLKRFEEALADYDNALALKPDYAEALSNRGLLLHERGRSEQAGVDFARALAISPELPYAQGWLLSSRMHCCDWRAFASELKSLVIDLRAGKRTSYPFGLLGLSASAGDQLRCSEVYIRDTHPLSSAPVWRGERYRHERIRIAYLSADFRDHAVCRLLAGVFEQHDHARFDTTALSFGPNVPSQMRSRVQRAFDRFVDVRNKKDREVANLLRELEIDIAVDLMGDTRDNRCGIFASRPAPVQVNYLGYPGTTGAEYMDYIIADRYVIPPSQSQYYREKVVWLPDTFQANDSTRKLCKPQATRAGLGLPDSGFVFCSFSNTYKITPSIFDVWMRLLRNIEGSVLWLVPGRATVEKNLRREAEARGVSPQRLVFATSVDYPEYLSRYKLADLFLDTLPFNAGATASDALWAGLPVITCSGESFASRMAGSLLHAIGLPELIAPSLDRYETLVLELARNKDLLTAIRVKLARHRDTSPLFDTDRFRRHLEAAYTTMWERYQLGESPASFAVEHENVPATPVWASTL